jgi:hypothetical protein
MVVVATAADVAAAIVVIIINTVVVVVVVVPLVVVTEKSRLDVIIQHVEGILGNSIIQNAVAEEHDDAEDNGYDED